MRGEWVRTEGPQLTGKTIGLIGYGGIGAEVARLAGGMGMRVLAWNRTAKSAPGVRFVDLDTLLSESDVVSLHLLLDDKTRGFLSAGRLARMRPNAILVNTARGALVDEAALIAALRDGRIRHAALDVFNEEPLPVPHPLTELDNVTLSAHSAFRTPELSETLLRRALDIARGLAQASLERIPAAHALEGWVAKATARSKPRSRPCLPPPAAAARARHRDRRGRVAPGRRKTPRNCVGSVREPRDVVVNRHPPAGMRRAVGHPVARHRKEAQVSDEARRVLVDLLPGRRIEIDRVIPRRLLGADVL